MKILFATGNENKLKEISKILEKDGIIVEMARLDLPEIQSDSLEAVARVKINSAVESVQKPVIAEDTGFFIDALNGFPGVFASHVFKTIGNKGILKLMEGIADRNAKFVTVAALGIPSKEPRFFLGETCGTISLSERGTLWGFDPIFIPEGHSKTYAELGLEEKNTVSHRMKAVTLLAKWIHGHKSELA